MKSMSRSTISANSNSSNSSVLGVVLFTNDDTSAATTMDNLVRHDQQQPHTTLRAIVSAAANGSGRGKVLLNTTTATPTTTTTSSNSHGHSSKIGNNSVGNSIKISKPGNGRSSTVIPRRVSTASSLLTTTTTTSTGGSEDSFPIKLHRLLTEATETGDTDVVGWNTEGTAFTIFQPKVFSETWMKRYFNQSRYKSFQRQCNLYNFERQNLGKVKGHCKYCTNAPLQRIFHVVGTHTRSLSHTRKHCCSIHVSFLNLFVHVHFESRRSSTTRLPRFVSPGPTPTV